MVRITQNTMIRNYLTNMNMNMNRWAKSQDRMLGQKYRNASENLGDTSRALRVRQELHENEEYLVGVRDAADLAYEARLDCANRHLLPEFETVCLLARPQMSFLSAGIVREIASYGGDITGLVPEPIENKIAERLMNL